MEVKQLEVSISYVSQVLNVKSLELCVTSINNLVSLETGSIVKNVFP